MGTLFKNAVLLQLDPACVEIGDLRQEGGRIVAVGGALGPEDGDEVVACDGAVLMPGLVNGHTHIYSALAAGMPAPAIAPTCFHENLQYIWWRLDRAHTIESTRTGGTIGALAAVRCGTTTLVDHHAAPDAIDGSLDALEEGVAAVGCRGVHCYEVTNRNRKSEATEGIAENERYIRRCQERGGSQFAGMVGGHASFTLSEGSLAGCVDLARRLGVGVHLHAAEDPVDERLTRQAVGCGLIDRFDAHGLLDLPGTLIAHGTHFSDTDVARINERSDTLTMAHNPRSNMKNGVGYARPARLAKPPALGTDGIGANLFAEAQAATFKSNDAGTPLASARPLEMLGESARFASQSLGVELGLLKVGAAADLVLTNYRPATPLSAENVAGHWIYAMGSEYVRSVMIDGHWVLRNGHIVTCDEAAARAGAGSVARALHERVAAL